jgi:predicted deacylase
LHEAEVPGTLNLELLIIRMAGRHRQGTLVAISDLSRPATFQAMHLSPRHGIDLYLGVISAA